MNDANPQWIVRSRQSLMTKTPLLRIATLSVATVAMIVVLLLLAWQPDAPTSPALSQGPAPEGECRLRFTQVPSSIAAGQTGVFRWEHGNADPGTLLIVAPDPAVARVVDYSDTSVSLLGRAAGVSEVTVSMRCENPKQAGQWVAGSAPVLVGDADGSSLDSWPSRDDPSGEVENAPDLEALYPAVIPNRIEQSGNARIGVEVHNEGDNPASATTLTFYHSTNAYISRYDTALATHNIPILLEYTYRPEVHHFTAPSKLGTHYYGACVEAVPGEFDTTNNCSSAVALVVVTSTPTPTISPSPSPTPTRTRTPTPTPPPEAPRRPSVQAYWDYQFPGGGYAAAEFERVADDEDYYQSYAVITTCVDGNCSSSNSSVERIADDGGDDCTYLGDDDCYETSDHFVSYVPLGPGDSASARIYVRACKNGAICSGYASDAVSYIKPAPTATPRPPAATSTPRPTATPWPTATPRPTATSTPQPTSTPRPTPTPLPRVSAPTGLNVTSHTLSSVSLKWNAPAGAAAYRVEYRKGTSGSWDYTHAYSGTSFTVPGLECNTTYQFRVRARGNGLSYSRNYGNPSQTVSETTDLCIVSAPTNFKVTAENRNSISLSWNASAGATAYRVEYQVSGSASWSFNHPTGSTSDIVSGLTTGTMYRFRVRARGDGITHSANYGNPSNVVEGTVSTPPQFGRTQYDFPTPPHTYIPHDATLGSAVGTVVATDPDPGDTLTYSIVHNPGNKFAINPSDGTITIAAPPDPKLYHLVVGVTDSRGEKDRADVRVTFGKPLAIFGEWGVLHDIRFKMDWIVPQAQRMPGYEYELAAYGDTGFQINPVPTSPAGHPTARECDWSTPPPVNTGWVGPDDEFFLVRCDLGTGKLPLYLRKRPQHSSSNPPLTKLGSVIEEAWHRADHQVDYKVDSSLLIQGPPFGYTHTNYISATDFEAGVNKAAVVWNNTQVAKHAKVHASFSAVTGSPDTTIQGYWNPTGGTNLQNRCSGSVACTDPSTGGSADYPHLMHQNFWVEFPPQYNRDPAPKQWTNIFKIAHKRPDLYYYLPHIMMHELGHIAGLGHANYGNIMGGVDPTNYKPLIGPSSYDLDGMKHIYQNHVKH